MSLVDDQSVHLVVTSPPYWQLKDYGSPNQIGFDHSYEEYINNLNLVWKECHRVLHDGCRLCINIGDQFARSVYYGRYKVIPIRTEITRFCETISFDFMGSIIWQKVTTCNTTGGASVMGSFPYPRNGIVKIDYEFILLFKKHGQAPVATKSAKEASKMTTEEWNSYFSGHWNFPGEKQDGHLAMFPEELPKRLIRMFSFVDETVLDPFLGSGTTAATALKLQRNSLGYEINKEFLPFIQNKFSKAQGLFSNVDFDVLSDSSVPTKEDYISLPYQFIDPLKLDKKLDPHKLKFGSRIGNSDSAAPEQYTVKQILAPDRFVLNNGLNIRLLGVRPLVGFELEGRQFMEKMIRGKQVSLKFDETLYDDANNLFVYLYLKNKTFVNAHFLKSGLAVLDRDWKMNNRSLLKMDGTIVKRVDS
ncbi:MAG: DNA methyltransferase [candidate division Zixibacteria bacterium]|nr:DNA methyltransferase [candidate division Zixibacteria bacterium]